VGLRHAVLCTYKALRMLMETSMSGAFEKYSLTIHEACTYSGIGKTKLYEAIASGKLKAHKAGKRTLILSDDLRDYLSSLPLMVRAAEAS